MNVIFFITDQQRADHLGCAGNPVLRTPNLDQLASEGVRFSNAYVANPTCMPNRSSIMTGQYPNTCVRSFGVNLPVDIPTFSGVLREQGYTTKAIGKMHLSYWFRKLQEDSHSPEFMPGWMNPKTHAQMVENFPSPYYGFDSTELVVGHGDMCNGHYEDWVGEQDPSVLQAIRSLGPNILTQLYRKSPVPEDLYPTSYLTTRSIDFLERHARGEHGQEPFLLKVSYPDPHHPCTPPGKYADMYDAGDIDLPASFGDVASVKNHPFLGQRIDRRGLRNMMFRTSDEEEVRNFISHTYGMMTMIDDSVGQILSTLAKLGLEDDTMIVYTSDHGDMMGDHGMILKGWIPYQGILKIPMIIKVPGMTAGGVSDSLISSVDLAPTILNLCKVEKEKQSPDMQGIDVTPILENPESEVRDCCLIEVDEYDRDVANSTAKFQPAAGRLKYLMTGRYSLIVYDGFPGYGDLFDLQEDPNELNNLWDKDPELRSELVEKLLMEVIKQQTFYPKKQAVA